MWRRLNKWFINLCQAKRVTHHQKCTSVLISAITRMDLSVLPRHVPVSIFLPLSATTPIAAAVICCYNMGVVFSSPLVPVVVGQWHHPIPTCLHLHICTLQPTTHSSMVMPHTQALPTATLGIPLLICWQTEDTVTRSGRIFTW